MAEASAPKTPHAPKLKWTFHGSAIVRDYKAAADWLARVCGLRVLEYSVMPDAFVGRKGGCAWIGDSVIELMEPIHDDAPPARFLSRMGPGLFGFAAQINSIEDTRLWLTAHDIDVVGDAADGYVFSIPRQTCGVGLEWADGDFSAWDPRQGAALPAPDRDPLVNVERVAWWGAQVADRAEAAKHYKAFWPGDVILDAPEASPDQPFLVLSTGDGAFALFDLTADEKVWGLAGVKPRMHHMALLVSDLEHARKALIDEGVRIAREDPSHGLFVTHPDDTQGLTLVWTDRLLPGDPRSE